MNQAVLKRSWRLNNETTFGLKPERLAKLLRIGLEKEAEEEGYEDLLSPEQPEDEEIGDSLKISLDKVKQKPKPHRRGKLK